MSMNRLDLDSRAALHLSLAVLATSASFFAPLVLLAAPALAQPSAQAEAQALALFKDAVAALNRADYAAACPRFDAAMKLFPAPATQLNIARCFEHDGKIASAWVAYQRVLVLNRDTKEQQRREALDKLANDGAAAMERKLPRLRIVVSGPPAGLTVTEDGVELPATSWGQALPVDPGAHELTATAPGFAPWKQTVTASEGKTGDVTIALTALTAPTELPRSAGLRASEPPRSVSTKRGVPVWAWAVGGAGIALGAVAAGFRADWARIDSKQLAAGCGSNLQSCPSTYTTLDADNAQKRRDRALFYTLGATGIAGVGASVVGIVTGMVRKEEPRSTSVRAAPLFGRSMSGVAVEGRF